MRKQGGVNIISRKRGIHTARLSSSHIISTMLYFSHYIYTHSQVHDCSCSFFCCCCSFTDMASFFIARLISPNLHTTYITLSLGGLTLVIPSCSAIFPHTQTSNISCIIIFRDQTHHISKQSFFFSALKTTLIYVILALSTSATIFFPIENVEFCVLEHMKHIPPTTSLERLSFFPDENRLLIGLPVCKSFYFFFLPSHRMFFPYYFISKEGRIVQLFN